MFQLEKTSKKFICPNCLQKRFVRYKNEQGEDLADGVGRCDREAKCGYHFTPKQFFISNPQRQNEPFRSGQKQATVRQGLNDKNGSNRSKSQRFEDFKPNNFDDSKNLRKPKISTINKEHFTDSLTNYEKNNFVYFLKTLFTAEIVQSLIDRFGIGTVECYGVNATAFWQIDQKGFLRTARIMFYDREIGKRKTLHTYFDDKGELVEMKQTFFHSILKQRKILSENFELKQCLFGLHQLLIDSEKDKPIGIVESDKTAIISTAMMPDFVWMSIGAKGYLNAEKLQPLANRKVILFPDSDGFNNWSEKAKTLRLIVPSLKVSDYLEKTLTDEQKKQGFDIADFLINEQQENLRKPKILDVESFNQQWRELDKINQQNIYLHTWGKATL